MQGQSPSGIRINQPPFNATLLLSHMPHPPEMASPGISDKVEAIKQANEAASKTYPREVDSALLLVKAFAL